MLTNKNRQTPNSIHSFILQRRWLRLGASLGACGVILLFASGFGGRRGCGHHRHRHDPAAMLERSKAMSERALSRVDATDEQKAQVAAHLEAFVTTVTPLHEEHNDLHKKLSDILSAAEIDGEQLESVRQATMQRMEAFSKHLATLMLNVAETLTPEQRQALAKHFQDLFRRHH